MENWIKTKIFAYLTSKEGCQIEYKGVNVYIVDALGFRYEVSVTLVGRNSHEASIQELTRYADETKTMDIPWQEKRTFGKR